MMTPSSTRLHGTVVPETRPLLPEDTEEFGSDCNVSDEHDSTARSSLRARPTPFSEDGEVQPHGSRQKILAAMFGFLLQGLFSSGIGTIIPKLENSYAITDSIVSLIFLCSPIGYLIAASLNSNIHIRFGQRGIAVIGPICQLIYAVTASTDPPFPIFLLAVVLGGIGSGLIEAAWCAWTAGMGKDANKVQGYLHGAYSIGCSLGPLMIGGLISASRTWRVWYALLSIVTVCELITSSFAFRYEDAASYRHGIRKLNSATRDTDASPTPKSLLRYTVSWICGAFLLAYVGTETSITGWIVVFMTRTRHVSLVFAGLFSSLFNIGMGVGRLTLGALTDTLGVRVALKLYLLIALGSQAAFTIITNPSAEAAFMTILGVALGPMFPSCITMLVLSLPRTMHVQGVASVALLGQLGGALMPFGQGLLAEKLGIQMYPYIILFQVAVLLALCFCFPRHTEGSTNTEDEI